MEYKVDVSNEKEWGLYFVAREYQFGTRSAGKMSYAAVGESFQGAERKIFETEMNDDFAPTIFFIIVRAPPKKKNMAITYDKREQSKTARTFK